MNPKTLTRFIVMLLAGSFGFHCSVFSGGAEHPGWTYTNTGTNHIILIPVDAPVYPGGIPLDSGDYVGVFFDSLGVKACGGYLRWEGNTSALAAWGNDQGHDGFAYGEKFTWKVWKKAENRVLEAFAEFDGETPGFNYDSYLDNGMSALISLKAYFSQEIPLASGWNLISLNLQPVSGAPDSLFAPLGNNFIAAHDAANHFFWPAGETYSMGQIDPMKGYFLKVNDPDTLLVFGSPLCRQGINPTMPFPKELLGYPREFSSSIALTDGFEDALLLDGQGKVFSGDESNAGLRNFEPGHGYRLIEAQSNAYTFLPDSIPLTTETEPSISLLHFSQPLATDNAHLFLFEPACWDSLPEAGDEVGVFDSNGMAIGGGCFTGGACFVVIWGPDPLVENDGSYPEPGGNLSFRLWKKDQQEEFQIEIDSTGGDGSTFTTNGFTRILQSRWVVEPPLPGNEFFTRPDETGQGVVVGFFLSESSDVSIHIFDACGRLIAAQTRNNMPVGNHDLQFPMVARRSGIYVARITSVPISAALRFGWFSVIKPTP